MGAWPLAGGLCRRRLAIHMVSPSGRRESPRPRANYRSMMRGTVRLVVAAFCLLAGLPIGSVEPVCSNAKHLPPPLRRPHHANAGAWGGIDGRRIISRVDAIGGGGGGLGLRLLDRLRGGGQTQLDQAEKNAKEEEERRIAILAEKQKKGMPPDSIMVPYDIRKVHEAVEMACGRVGRFLAYPEPNQHDYIEPQYDEMGEPILVTWAEWRPGTGQKIYVRWGLYKWGSWSERRQCYRKPELMCIKGHLDVRGEDGTVLCGQWLMFQGSSGRFKELMLKTQQFIPGVGGGMCIHIAGGDWRLENCQLRCIPGALVTIMGVSGQANVTMDWCLITRDINVAFGAWGYGIFSWGKKPKVDAVDCTFTELKVAVDSADFSHLNFTRCTFYHNRIGFMVRGNSNINITEATFKDNHKASFIMGIPNRGSVARRGPPKAQLRVLNTTFQSNDVFFGKDRPWVFEEHGSTYELMDQKPTTYEGTNIELRGVPQAPPLLSEESIERMQYRQWMFGNWTSQRCTMTTDEFDPSRAFQLC